MDHAKALRNLEHAFAHGVARGDDPVDETTRCAVALRDELIARRRSGDARAGEWLREANRVLSDLVGAEYPLVGVVLQRVKTAHQSYHRLIDALRREAPSLL